MIRAARYVLLRARLDGPNDMAVNGELALQEWVLARSPAGAPVHVADVGANVGQWSRSLLVATVAAGRTADIRLHVFEPDAMAFARLSVILAGAPAVLSPVALSDRAGTAVLHVVAPAAGTNSLHPAPGSRTAGHSVAMDTLDGYAASNAVPRFALVKVDTEGHDLVVIRGMRGLLADQRIAVLQFEYNHRWVFARAFLRDAFEFLASFGYRLGKLTPRGVEFYPGWDPDLETFTEGNYVACAPAVATSLPAVPWWKTSGGRTAPS